MRGSTRLNVLLMVIAGAAAITFGMMFALDVRAQTPPGVRGTIDANAETVTIATLGKGAVGVQLVGTMSGTITFEGSADGTTYVGIRCLNANTSVALAPATGATAAGLWQCAAGGLNQVRARATAWTSGSAAVTLQRGDGPLPAAVTP
jgi:hypothetical protein